METQMWEKNHGSPQTAKITMREERNNGKAQRHRPLAPLLRHTAVTMEATTSFTLSLTHTLYAVTLYTHNTTSNNINYKFSLSHIYTNMTFGLFTHLAPGLFRTYSHECPFRPVGEDTPGLQTSGSSQVPSGGTCFPTKMDEDSIVTIREEFLEDFFSLAEAYLMEVRGLVEMLDDGQLDAQLQLEKYERER